MQMRQTWVLKFTERKVKYLHQTLSSKGKTDSFFLPLGNGDKLTSADAYGQRKDKSQCWCSLVLHCVFCLLLEWYSHSWHLKQRDKPKHWVDPRLVSKCSYLFPSLDKKKEMRWDIPSHCGSRSYTRNEKQIQGNDSQPPHPPFKPN